MNRKLLSHFQLPFTRLTVKMWHKVLLVNSFILFSAVLSADNNSKIVCYYDSRAFVKEGKRVRSSFSIFYNLSQNNIWKDDDINNSFSRDNKQNNYHQCQFNAWIVQKKIRNICLRCEEQKEKAFEALTNIHWRQFFLCKQHLRCQLC